MRKARNLDGQGHPVGNTASLAAIARANSPQEQLARQERLAALCVKFGVPVDMERPLRDQLLIAAMWKDKPMRPNARLSAHDIALKAVTRTHTPGCVCEICYPKRVRTGR